MSFTLVEGDVVIRDSSGNAVGVVLDGVVYRLQVESKVTSSVLPTGAATEATLQNVATEATVATLATEATLQTIATEATVATLATEVTQQTLATEATAATLLTEADFDARVNTLGQKTMVGSTPVVLASDQTSIPVTDNGGSLTVDNANLDVALSTRASEATLGTRASEATLATRATESTASSIDTKLTDGTQKSQIVDGANALDVNASGQAAIQNPPNLDVAASTLATEATVSTLATESTQATLLTELEFEARVGEVQASPTANTLLGRLKDIYDSIVARLGTLGQKTMDASTPVVIASDQSRVLTEATIANEDGRLAVTDAGNRTYVSIEADVLLEQLQNISAELYLLRRHMQVITNEEFDDDSAERW